ncbi:MAG: CDP-alcohol phosphatidyltransferase family protein [Alphaproteobacteria bacterium]|nr:CDP-alcohol phosphatidyltransferase family protein [Alphaproteobacteria bacterium]
MDRPAIADVVRAYRGAKSREELFGEWGAAVCYRPFSFLLTPWAVAVGLGPTTVTVLSFLVVLALPLLALLGGGQGHLALSLGAIAVGILDCVDGDIARVTGRISRFGQYCDFIVDVLYRPIMYGAVGVLIQAGVGTAGDLGWLGRQALALGILAALLAITARLSRVYVERWPEEANPYDKPVEGEAPPKRGLLGLVFPFISGLDHLLPFFVLVAGASGQLEWVLVWLLAYSALDFLYTEYAILRRLA